MTRISVAGLVLAALSGSGAGALASPNGVTVHDNVVTSQRNPAAQVRVPASTRYAGSAHWRLYGIADCRLFAFAEPDAGRVVRRLYWVQFEGYLPEYPKLQHDYRSPRHAKLGGMDFYVDTWAKSTRATPDPRDLAAFEAVLRADGYTIPAAAFASGSDADHFNALLRAAGFTLPEYAAYVRFVHLLDGKRKELMIIYGEEASSPTLTASQTDALIARAERSVAVMPLP